MDKVKEFFANHYLKFISLILSIFLWSFAVNSYDPLETFTFSVKLKLENIDELMKNQYLLANQNELKEKILNVTVRDRKKILDRLKKVSSEISAYVDLKPIDYSLTSKIGQPLKANINFELPQGFDSKSIIYKSANTVDIILDKFTFVDKEILLLSQGKAKEGYVSTRESIDPKTVRISGAKTIIDTIKEAHVVVNLNDSSSDIKMNSNIIVIDGNNKDITKSLTLSEPAAKVNIPVYKIQKIKINPPTYRGKVKDGYFITNVNILPEYAEVVGREEDFSKLTAINLKTFDVSGLDKGFSETINLHDFFKDTNMSIMNGTEDKVVVKFEINKIELKQVVLPASQLEIKNQTKPIEIQDDTFKVTLQGTKEDLVNVNPETIKASIDLEGLTPGIKDIVVNFVLPENIILKEDTKIKVEIYE